MKKILIITTICLSAGNALAAQKSFRVADQKSDVAKTMAPYFSVKGGITNDLPNTFNSNLASAAMLGAVGMKWGLGDVSLRGELEYMYSADKKTYFMTDYTTYELTTKEKTKSNSVTANFIMDFLPGYKVSPYVGYGLGLAKINESSDSTVVQLDPMIGIGTEASPARTSNLFIHGILVGLSFDITQNITGDIGFRYMESVSNLNRADGYYYSYEQQIITAGIRYTF